MPRPSKGERVAFTVRLKPEQASALDLWAGSIGLDRSEAVAELIDRRLGGEPAPVAVAPRSSPPRSTTVVVQAKRQRVDVVAPKRERITMAELRGPYKPNFKADKGPKR